MPRTVRHPDPDLAAFQASLAEGIKFAQGRKANVKVDKIHVRTSPRDLKEARKVLKVSQPQFARLFGYSPEAVKKWEQGVNPVPGGVSHWVQAALRYPKEARTLLLKLAVAR